MGAVNNPDALTVPDAAAHVTPVFVLLLTVAMNCWVFPETMVAVEDDAEILTALALGDKLPPPQAARIRPDSIRHARNPNKPKPESLFRCGFGLSPPAGKPEEQVGN